MIPRPHLGHLYIVLSTLTQSMTESQCLQSTCVICLRSRLSQRKTAIITTFIIFPCDLITGRTTVITCTVITFPLIHHTHIYQSCQHPNTILNCFFVSSCFNRPMIRALYSLDVSLIFPATIKSKSFFHLSGTLNVKRQ